MELYSRFEYKVDEPAVEAFDTKREMMSAAAGARTYYRLLADYFLGFVESSGDYSAALANMRRCTCQPVDRKCRKEFADKLDNIAAAAVGYQ